MTKPGNSGSEEPTQAVTPETPPEAPNKPATSDETPTPHESPIGGPGGPPDSTLPESTDNSGSDGAAAKDAGKATDAGLAGAEPEDAEPGDAGDAADAGLEGAGLEGAEPERAGDEEGAADEAAEREAADADVADGAAADDEAADGEAADDAEDVGAENAEGEAADGESDFVDDLVSADEPKSTKAETRRPVRGRAGDDGPAKAGVEKTTRLGPKAMALRAQAKRRFEEPPPRMLRFSFYFFTAAGAIWLISMIASLIYKQDIIDNEVKVNTNPKITPDQIASAVNQILWVVTIAALAFTIFLSLFGYKATEGTRRARTLVTIFAVMLVLFHILLNPTQLGILSALFGLVGLFLLWSPSARKYFPPRNVP